MDVKVELVLGKDLTADQLKTINYHRIREFDSKTVISPSPDNDDWTKPYFLVKSGQGKLLGFGRLHSINAIYRGKKYPILGIASIISIEKKKGYGKMILGAMKEYSKKKRMTAIGFCDPEDTLFYEKCGLGIINGMDRFVFHNGPKSTKPGNVVYIEETDGLIEEMMSYPDDKVVFNREEW